MKILVTGASGTIGTELVRRLLSERFEVYCQSRTPRESAGGEKWLTFDLADSATALRDSGQWDTVFHLAGRTSLISTQEDPRGAFSDNVVSLAALLDAVKYTSQAALVVIAGTATQVGLPDATVITEDLVDKPVTFYDITKLAAEMLLKQYVREGWLKGCCLRLATVFGAIGTNQAADRGIIDRVTRQALDGRNVTIYGSGEYLRDYVHVDDVVDAFIKAAEHPNEVNGKAFVVGTGKSITLKEAFACAVDVAADVTGRRVELLHIPPPKGMSPIEFRNAVIDATAFREATGWSPKYDLRSGLSRTYLSESTQV